MRKQLLVCAIQGRTSWFGNEGEWVDPYVEHRGGGRSAFGMLKWGGCGYTNGDGSMLFDKSEVKCAARVHDAMFETDEALVPGVRAWRLIHWGMHYSDVLKKWQLLFTSGIGLCGPEPRLPRLLRTMLRSEMQTRQSLGLERPAGGLHQELLCLLAVCQRDGSAGQGVARHGG